MTAWPTQLASTELRGMGGAAGMPRALTASSSMTVTVTGGVVRLLNAASVEVVAMLTSVCRVPSTIWLLTGVTVTVWVVLNAAGVKVRDAGDTVATSGALEASAIVTLDAGRAPRAMV